ncbi:MAG: hypothetical protein NT126_06965 [Bacteroidetes bacterium]|nr:hypothetical protein [Bacteroidota bacterium]
MKSISKNNLIHIGFISKPSGFKGDVICAIETGEAEDYLDLEFLFIELEGKPVPFFAEEKKIRSDSMIVKLEDVNAESEAKKLSGKKIFVEKTGTPTATDKPDWDSLLGYTIQDKTYGLLGPLEGIEEFPQQLIGKCTVKGKEVLLPLHDELILGINDKKKEILLDLPAGFLDIYLD